MQCIRDKYCYYNKSVSIVIKCLLQDDCGEVPIP